MIIFKNLKVLIISSENNVLTKLNEFNTKFDSLSKKVNSIQELTGKNSQSIVELKYDLASANQEIKKHANIIIDLKKKLCDTLIDFYAFQDAKKEYTEGKVNNLKLIVNGIGLDYTNEQVNTRLLQTSKQILSKPKPHDRRSGNNM